jgi:hypothetical protein
MEVSVFMRIQVSRLNPRAYYSLDLGTHLPLDVADADRSTQLPDQAHDRSGQTTVGAQKRLHLCGRRHRATIDNRHMAAYAKARVGQRNFHGLVKRRSISHDSRAGQNAVQMAAQYTRVGTLSEPKVISVYYESLHCLSARPICLKSEILKSQVPDCQTS